MNKDLTNQMKILLFTHSQDIDGMGNILLAQVAFPNLDYIPCKTFDITKSVLDKIKDKSIYKYDYIYVTDLCPQEPVLSMINADLTLKTKFLVIDHHKSEIDKGNNQYPFVHITVENSHGQTSATSLFYDHLQKNHYLTTAPILDELVELTRQYDTWEWHDIYHNPKARHLHILFETLGYQQYLEIMTKMIKTKPKISFSKKEQQIINKFDQDLANAIPIIFSNMYIYNLTINKKTYRIGYVKTPYKYRNDLNEYIKKDNNQNLDALGMIMTDLETVSYRQVKDIDLSIIATYFGGKGHKKASTNPKNNEKFQPILNKIK